MPRKNKAVVIVPVIVLGLIASGFISFWVLVYVAETQDFDVVYDGIIEGKFKGRGLFLPCDQTSDGLWFTRIDLGQTHSDKGPKYIIITIPIESDPGVYSLSNSEDLAHISATIYDEHIDDILYFPSSDIISGKLELDTLPSKPYQPVEGSFKAKFQGRDGDLVIEGDFKFEASGDFSYDCLK